jgi:hypothetical protein
MFPIAHSWLLERLLPDPSPAHYLGCVWPDMLFGSPLSHQQSHRSGAALTALARELSAEEDGAEFRAFIAGVLSHGTEPHGFDWYSDEQWGDQPPEERGYAFQRGRGLADDAARACGLPPEQGWWKAHNLIEMAFEVPLYSAHPHLGERLAAACADRALAARMADPLARHFAVDAGALAEAMARFPGVVELHPTDSAALARVYALQVRLKHQTEADVPAITELIERADELVAFDGKEYLATCVSRVGAMLATSEIGIHTAS